MTEGKIGEISGNITVWTAFAFNHVDHLDFVRHLGLHQDKYRSGINPHATEVTEAIAGQPYVAFINDMDSLEVVDHTELATTVTTNLQTESTLHLHP